MIFTAVRRLPIWKAMKDYAVVQTGNDGVWTRVLVVAVAKVHKFTYILEIQSTEFSDELSVDGM